MGQRDPWSKLDPTVSVGPAVMIYRRGEGVEELEGTLKLWTMVALRGAGGVGYRNGQQDASSYSCYIFRLSHCLMLVEVLVYRSELGWVGRLIV